MEQRSPPPHLMAVASLELDHALLALRRRGMLRESEVDRRTLLSLHALGAAGQVEVDWGIGGWQFFIVSSGGTPSDLTSSVAGGPGAGRGRVRLDQ